MYQGSVSCVGVCGCVGVNCFLFASEDRLERREICERKKREGGGEDGIMHPAPCSVRVPCYRVNIDTSPLRLCSPPLLSTCPSPLFSSSPLLLFFVPLLLSFPVIPRSLKRNPLSMETGRLCRLFVASVVTLVTMLTGVYVIMQVMKYVLHLNSCRGGGKGIEIYVLHLCHG